MRWSFLATALLIASGLTYSLRAGDPDRDFSGKWVLDPASSDLRSLGQVESSLTVSQSALAILCSTGPLGWSYALDGSETRKRIGDESWNSVTKWEGAALLVNTLVSGPRDYTVMDRWELSRDHSTLTITRQVVRAGGGTESRRGRQTRGRGGVPAGGGAGGGRSPAGRRHRTRNRVAPIRTGRRPAATGAGEETRAGRAARHHGSQGDTRPAGADR